MTVTLPDGYSLNDKGVFVIDPDAVYPKILVQIAKARGDVDDEDERCNPDSPTQYWLEHAFQFAKLDLMAFIRINGIDPRTADPPKPLQIHINSGGGRKGRWALAAHPKGPQRGFVRGEEAMGAKLATEGKHVRDLYRQMRGFIPA